MTSPATRLRARLASERITVVPGAVSALTARVIEDTGFEAAYITGAGVANTYLGVPDIGLLTLTELLGHVTAIRSAVQIPVIVDADTGFGNPINVRRTVTELERAGADGLLDHDGVISWDERRRLVGKPEYERLEQRYATAPDEAGTS